MKSLSVCLAAAMLLIAGGSFLASAGPVSATPGFIKGVITLNAPFVPDVMEVDAQDATHTYNATGNATQNDAMNCAPGSQNWCYNVTVESALASSYYVRPIARAAKSIPFLMTQVPFPPAGPVAITAGATVVQNVTYQPAEISGNIQFNDLMNSPLPLLNVYLSINDTTNNASLFQDVCKGSLDGCPYNSIFQFGSPSTNLAYQIYPKPNDTYQYLSRGVSMQEAPPAQASFIWDQNFPATFSLIAGQNVTTNYVFNQKAQVTGNVQLALPVYNLGVSVSGNTIDGGSFSDNYMAAPSSSMPLVSSSYINRIFDNADFTKSFTLSPSFTLSADGQTSLQYPPITFTANPGDQKVINFNDTPSSISGRVTFNPPYPASLIYPGVQAEALTMAGFGSAQTELATDPLGGTFFLPVLAGNWDYWRFGWNFNLGNPNFTSWYQVGQFLSFHVPVAPAQNVTGQTFTFGTAKVKVFFQAPPNTTLTYPQLDAGSGTFNGGNFTEDFADIAHAEGLNQSQVMVGEADMILRVDSNLGFRIIPSAIINTSPSTPGTSRTDFSPIVVKPNQGDVIIVGVPGSLSLTVNTPVEGQVLTTCQVPVSGTATGTTNITITVNGTPVATTSAGNPNDPNQVKFSTTVPGSGSNTTITVVASAPNNTSVTDVIHVNAAPAIVNTTAQVGTTMLWPPNHDMVNVGLSAMATSACDASPTVGVTVWSNESETGNDGDGEFSPDANNIAPGTLRLRSERDGTGNGRVYLIIATGSDHSGDRGTACTSVVVPHDQTHASEAAVEAAASAAVASCKNTGVAPAGFQRVGLGPVIGPKQ